jgi:flagellar motor switch protein FliN/FliY
MPETAQAVAEPVTQNQESPASAKPIGEAGSSDSKTKAQTADFPEAVETATSGGGGSIDILLDMTIPVTVTIGTTQIPIRRLLHLGPGSVVKLDKPVDAPMDLYLKEAKFATGNVVVVDGRFAVKIKQILGLGELKPEEKK